MSNLNIKQISRPINKLNSQLELKNFTLICNQKTIIKNINQTNFTTLRKIELISSSNAIASELL